MSQKELNYIEDIYNHEILIINVLEDINTFLDDSYNINNHIKEHKSLIKNLNKLMEENL